MIVNSVLSCCASANKLQNSQSETVSWKMIRLKIFGGKMPLDLGFLTIAGESIFIKLQIFAKNRNRE